MIYDCFNFFDELDLLELRLRELESVVDKFVLVESTVTFTNKPKKLYYQENRQRFKRFSKKIIHVVVDDSPNVSLPWIIEHFQFAAVSRGLKACKTNDVVLLSSVDEIPKKDLIPIWAKKKGKHKMFSQHVCEYFLNFMGEGEGAMWPCTSMFFYKDLCTYIDPYIARFSPTDTLIPDGGWHFTFIGDVKRIQQKLSAWSHQEYNNDSFNTREYLEHVINHGDDILGRKMRFTISPLSLMPREVQDNPQRYKDILLKESPKISPVMDLYLSLKKSGRLLIRSLRTFV